MSNITHLVVGSGPIGLYTAACAKMLNSDLEIAVSEKPFLRTHNLRIDENSFSGAPDHPVMKKFLAECRKQRFIIRTNVIEQLCKEMLKELNVPIVGEVAPEKLKEKYPNIKHVVLADGVQGTFSPKIFNDNDKPLVRENLNQLAQVTYDAIGSAEKMSYLRTVGNHKIAMTSVEETVGRVKDGKTAVTVRIFIDEKTVAKMRPDGKSKKYALYNKFDFSKDDKIGKPSEVDPVLLKQARAWIKARAEITGETIDKTTAVLNVIPLNSKIQGSCVKEIDGVTYTRVGDSFAFVPYFRALNLGLICATQLARTLAGKAINRSATWIPFLSTQGTVHGNASDEYKAYSKFAFTAAKVETVFAKIKNFFILAYVNYSKVLGSLYRKLNIISDQKLERLDDQDTEEFNLLAAPA